MDRTHDTEVLIAGAGPTGLVLALWLARRGIRLRIVDKVNEPGTTSRALVVHARTLELYRALGIADGVVRESVEFAAVNLWVRGRHVARAWFGDIGRGLSPFPFLRIFPQDEHECFLIAQLARAGVEVERGVELTAIDPQADRVVATLRKTNGNVESCTAAYVAGCDGAHSMVREALHVGFPGGTYEHIFYVADVELDGPITNGELHVALDEADFIAAFPLKRPGTARLVGTVRRDVADRRALEWSDVSGAILEHMRIRVGRVNWFSTYHVHHRVAERFQRGRVFLAGDAAHIHSPVGGQGMNTGIGDAVNLAWKLAAVLRGEAGEGVLDTYEPERIAFARKLVKTTDRAFTFATRDGSLARLMRFHVIPAVFPRLTRFEWVRKLMFGTVSQIRLNYRQTPWNEGRAGSVRGGDRLPWIAPETTGGEDDFTPLSSLDWQVHVHGEASADIVRVCAERALPLRVFAWSAHSKAAGFARDALYLVRPDGYVALADPRADARRLAQFLDTRNLHARASNLAPGRVAHGNPAVERR